MTETEIIAGRLLKGKVVRNIDLGMYDNDPIWKNSLKSNPGHHLLEIESEWLAMNSRPGQFVHILPPGTDMLRRPLSVFDVDKTENLVKIIFRVIGEGTKILSQTHGGDILDLIGPLGNGFQIDFDCPAIIIGGGVGIPPMFFLARYLISEFPGENSSRPEIRVFLGSRDRSTLLCLDNFNELGLKPKVATEDGSYGLKGLVTDSLKEESDIPKNSIVYACGPIPMLAAIAKWASRKKLSCQVSLENKFGCGIGACLGCSVPVKSKDSKIHYERVCCEGPVFDASRIVFSKL